MAICFEIAPRHFSHDQSDMVSVYFCCSVQQYSNVLSFSATHQPCWYDLLVLLKGRIPLHSKSELHLIDSWSVNLASYHVSVSVSGELHSLACTSTHSV